ncbi:phosphoribosylformylglycinamidine synthase [Petrocella sp. FN5]|uniref:phosphoribosylformylglycinamidine synthase n=1 Tax=Petrocella sp. FN5 TaxID=3032002 RepID=UPI0023DADEF8|nr:phosphoribosylformylglycinamidine synthase [Petrocella sp. FN5]MDF1617807.1 phosphoribosylformylglycinamidine synthase [Petrocella sp. FN5]
MEAIRRIFVEKKTGYNVESQQLLQDIKENLDIKTLENLRLVHRYDVSHITDDAYEKALHTIFSEPPVDQFFEESFEMAPDEVVFGVEYLPGQYDQRADSTEQCIEIINADDQKPVVRSAKMIVLKGQLSEENIEKIKSYCINPVDSREADLLKPQTLEMAFHIPTEVETIEGFIDFDYEGLTALWKNLGLAMSLDDLLHTQKYFANDEKRNPTITEIKVLDTYWSDHCRHTTFLTKIENVTFEEGFYNQPIQATYKDYLEDRNKVFGEKVQEKDVCLMDIALLAMRKLRKDGQLEDLEVSDEINACSIIVPVDVDGRETSWLVMFKNETHNHPTEIEPFGGAATCLGGAIRDPLSGRSYVYQAMRVTGAADPTVSINKTLPGKLPQRKIVTQSAHGYSSYGNQIGLATGKVDEIYHPDYVAKRLEIGAVIAAAPKENVIRETSDPGDIIVLLGGRTGRDGCGGATGSSKEHTEDSIHTCGAEVQKGNPPTERKIQRLFRDKAVASMIKKCNDFGAGGVSVAIGELADGLVINLDAVPKKYAGLDGTELSISESQERMAVVLDPQDVTRFIEASEKENLEAVVVARVTEEKRLVMEWNNKAIVNMSRRFVDTNGATSRTKVHVGLPKEKNYFKSRQDIFADKARTYDHWIGMLKDLNCCSKKGLEERFDSSIGGGSVLMPYGGIHQLTPTQSMVAKIPLEKGETTTGTIMAYGYNPYLTKWSPFHGAIYAVLDSVAKVVATGGDYKKIRFTFQEYFKRLGDNPSRWSEPFGAMLGAYHAQMALGLPSIGGKDSMSGTFHDIDVPPTLVSFAVDVVDVTRVISPEFKGVDHKVACILQKRDQFDLPDFEQMKKSYEIIYDMIGKKEILSAYAIGIGGMAEAISKMTFGNKIGIVLEESVVGPKLFTPEYGSILVELAPDISIEDLMDQDEFIMVGTTTEHAVIKVQEHKLEIEELINTWTSRLQNVFPLQASTEASEIIKGIKTYDQIYICKNKVAKPKVFMPVFPGTNCEYDSKRAFEKAGAHVETLVFRNLKAGDITRSLKAMAKMIEKSQIVMLPGGFSAGDEPEGSGKFIASIFRNQVLKEAIHELLYERDGLMIGICNGFQALIKLGLVPSGHITDLTKDAPTLTYNTIGRHVSCMAGTKVMSNKSPWLSGVKPGEIFKIPMSHGEGRFVASDQVVKSLFENGQIATTYVDLSGNPTMDGRFNPNGSVYGIEGITSPDGRVLGKMGHSERIGPNVAINIIGNQDQKIFESGVAYFTK